MGLADPPLCLIVGKSNRHRSMVLRQASDLKTRALVWVASTSTSGEGRTAATWGGACADMFERDVRRARPKFLD